MPRRATSTTMTIAISAAGIGLATWVATMATAARYSYGPNQETGGSAYYFVLLVAALGGGFVTPARASLVALMLVLPGLVLVMDSSSRRRRRALGPDLAPALPVRPGANGSRSCRSAGRPRVSARRSMTWRSPCGRARRTGGIRWLRWSGTAPGATLGATAVFHPFRIPKLVRATSHGPRRTRPQIKTTVRPAAGCAGERDRGMGRGIVRAAQWLAWRPTIPPASIAARNRVRRRCRASSSAWPQGWPAD